LPSLHIYFEIKSLILYYVTRFINGTLVTSFIRLERVFNKRVSREVYKRIAYYTFSTSKLTKQIKQVTSLLNHNLNTKFETDKRQLTSDN
jgi:hypothetical protein